MSSAGVSLGATRRSPGCSDLRASAPRKTGGSEPGARASSALPAGGTPPRAADPDASDVTRPMELAGRGSSVSASLGTGANLGATDDIGGAGGAVTAGSRFLVAGDG
eukprot:3572092-Pyramimonas_sp.AAC.2